MCLCLSEADFLGTRVNVNQGGALSYCYGFDEEARERSARGKQDRPAALPEADVMAFRDVVALPPAAMAFTVAVGPCGVPASCARTAWSGGEHSHRAQKQRTAAQFKQLHLARRLKDGNSAKDAQDSFLTMTRVQMLRAETSFAKFPAARIRPSRG